MGNRLILASLWAFLPAYAQITVTVSPSPASVHVGTFLQFAAKVSGTSTTGVAWSMTPATGAGSISTGGRYTPPATLPNPNTITVTATSTANPTASASAKLTILNPYPALASVNPTNIPVGAFAITVDGSG